MTEDGRRAKKTGDDDGVTHVGLPDLALLDYRDVRHIAYRPIACGRGGSSNLIRKSRLPDRE